MSFIRVKKLCPKEEIIVNTETITKIEKTTTFKKSDYRIRFFDDTSVDISREEAERLYCELGIPFQNDSESFKNISDKDPNIALWLCIFFGYMGAHYFYVRRIGMGCLYLCTLGLFGVGCIVDCFCIPFGKFKDNEGKFLM